jgi:site-specific recombinase XerD
VPVNSITQNDILNFLSGINKDTAQNTKIHRFRILSSFFNFTISSYDLGCDNPCQTPLVRKMFKGEQLIQWNILDKDIVDEIIFRTLNKRNRIILELMARAGMRINEVLNIKPQNIEGRKIKLYSPKSGKESEMVSKVILRHSNLATTQRYLGKVSDIEAIRWIEQLHG